MDARSDTSTNSTVNDVLQQDKERYVRKGYGLISAIALTFSFFIVLPKFYKIFWAYLLTHQFSDATLYMITMITIHQATYLIGNFIMFLIYSVQLDFFERYRIQNKPWPWEEDAQKWQLKKREVIKNWGLNQSLGILICVIDGLTDMQYKTSVDQYPSSLEIAWQIVVFMIAEDFSFYWTHRTIHHPKLYPLIHKKHHEFYTTISIASEYAHPIEFVFGNVIPTFLGAKFILGSQVHLATLNLWMFMRVLETIDGHSGYEFSWSPFRLLPFSASSEYHNFHHSHNVGNYGSFFTYWDSLYKTNIAYFRYLQQRKLSKKE